MSWKYSCTLCAAAALHAGGLGCSTSYGVFGFPGVTPHRTSLSQHPGVAHHFVGVIAVVLHAVLHQLLLVQVPGPTVRAHKRRAIWNIAKENKDELRSPREGTKSTPSKLTQPPPAQLCNTHA